MNNKVVGINVGRAWRPRKGLRSPGAGGEERERGLASGLQYLWVAWKAQAAGGGWVTQPGNWVKWYPKVVPASDGTASRRRKLCCGFGRLLHRNMCLCVHVCV